MRPWKVVLLVDLALLVGLGWGYVWWGRRAETLERALARSSTAVSGQHEWTVRGVVRAVLPDVNVIVFTHEDIPGYMTPMTMGFQVASPDIRRNVQVGDEVRFTIRGTPPNVTVTAIERIR